jgi:hypothetical protein
MKCVRCTAAPGPKKNPVGWTTILFEGKSRDLCPDCSVGWRDAVQRFNEWVLRWVKQGQAAGKK